MQKMIEHISLRSMITQQLEIQSLQQAAVYSLINTSTRINAFTFIFVVKKVSLHCFD